MDLSKLQAIKAEVQSATLEQFTITGILGGKKAMKNEKVSRDAIVAESTKHGVCSIVLSAETPTGTQVAIKLPFNYHLDATDAKIREDFSDEWRPFADPLQFPLHRHICPVLHSFVGDMRDLQCEGQRMWEQWFPEGAPQLISPKTLFLIMPRLEKSVASLMKWRPFTDAEVTKMAIQLMDALSHCKAHNIIHRDLKADNILTIQAGDDIDFVVADFGLAFDAVRWECPGTFRMSFAGQQKGGAAAYLAPEVMKVEYKAREMIDHKMQDEWAAGCLLHSVLCHCHGDSTVRPFGEKRDSSSFVQAEYQPPPKGLEILRQIISRLLQVDPHERVSSKDAYDDLVKARHHIEAKLDEAMTAGNIQNLEEALGRAQEVGVEGTKIKDGQDTLKRLIQAAEKLLAELKGTNLDFLRQKALEIGCEETVVQDADKADDAKQAVIDLILQKAAALGADAKLLVENESMTLKNLKQRALAYGCEETAVQDADDSDDPKQAVIDLMLQKAISAAVANCFSLQKLIFDRNEIGDEVAKVPPQCIQVQGAGKNDGKYRLKAGKINGHPVWENADSQRVVYCTEKGYWAMTDHSKALDGTTNYFHSEHPCTVTALPTEARWGKIKEGAWEHRANVVVTETQANAMLLPEARKNKQYTKGEACRMKGHRLRRGLRDEACRCSARKEDLQGCQHPSHNNGMPIPPDEFFTCLQCDYDLCRTCYPKFYVGDDPDMEANKLRPGVRVRVERTHLEDRNGKLGVLLNFDKESQRWGVRFDDGQELNIRRECLIGQAAWYSQLPVPFTAQAKQKENFPEVVMKMPKGETCVAKVPNGETLTVLEVDGDGPDCQGKVKWKETEGWVKMFNVISVAEPAREAAQEAQPFSVGDLVERRDHDSEFGWGKGYVTSINPLKVTVAATNPEDEGVSWDEVRQINAEAAYPKLLAKLKEMTLKRLKQRALVFECEEKVVEDADDAEDPKQAVIDLILQNMKAASDLISLLSGIGLEAEVGKFVDVGVTDVETLRDLSQSEIQDVVSLDAATKIMNALQQAQAQCVTPGEATADFISLLSGIGLAAEVGKFVDVGVTDVETLRELSKSDIQQVVSFEAAAKIMNALQQAQPQDVTPGEAEASIDVQPDDTITWRWGDLGWFLAKKDPLRWSYKKSPSETVSELAQKTGSEAGRPVKAHILRAGVVINKVHFNTVAEAMAALTPQVQRDLSCDAGENRKVRFSMEENSK